MLVIDCSIAMAWFFDEESTAATEAVQDQVARSAATVPAHFHLEVVNVLALAERKRRTTAERSAEFISLLRKLDLQTDEEVIRRAYSDILDLSRAHKLTTYDAAYLELALRGKLSLASLDADLRAAAKREGVALLGV